MNLLIIPDAHAHPDYDNDRFSWLGQYILDVRPDIIVCLGDFGDFPSLQSFDSKSGRRFEGRRYKKDLAVTEDAMTKLLEPLNRHNGQRGYKGRALYEPRKVMCLGNHEDRISRAIESDPHTLEGFISLDQLPYSGWEITPFKETIEIEEISFSHWFPSGLMSRPIGGEHTAATMCRKLFCSAVQGHSHLYNIAERTRPNKRKIFGLAAGCYVHPEYSEDWCLNTTPLWWRGVIELRELDGHGYYDQLITTTMRKLQRDYS